ncbi:ribosome maturation factor RimM [Hazenella sp. IB182357]|uniref:Ribosome maturation factor RimM n=1 Tax=Polycladospora coralii TaxID=2771432 RepID=A0A926N805_9BACL|nr:ribosome maturation factor RimM [Polycladospora coralii]MBD1371422.1 ribosome maturation factor RimM [Polycladospora coralii]MBS7530390.1 ribosome maturation factor RimM [Polycladospora coralii]
MEKRYRSHQPKRTDYLNVGVLITTHGIRGDVRVRSDTDFPDVRFAPGNQLLLKHEALSGLKTLTVEKCRTHKANLLIKFQEWNNINEAEPYKGGQLLVERDDLVTVDQTEGEFYFHQIIGSEVVTTTGDIIGKVTEILPMPANDVWVVQAPGRKKDILLPYIESVVKEVDIAHKKITIEWMEGLD